MRKGPLHAWGDQRKGGPRKRDQRPEGQANPVRSRGSPGRPPIWKIAAVRASFAHAPDAPIPADPLHPPVEGQAVDPRPSRRSLRHSRHIPERAQQRRVRR